MNEPYFDPTIYWQEGEQTIREILRVGMNRYTEGLKTLSEAFKLKDHSLRCMDEGTPGGVHCAGSGILLELDEVKDGFAEAHIDGIYSHAGCGAAVFYAKQQGLDAGFADEYGKEWAKSLAGNLGLPYKGHIEAEALARPSNLHIARAVYYDGTGTFDPSVCPDLPKGFVVSRKYMTPEYARKEAEIAIGIAVGNHGFGHKFSGDEPFLLIAVGRKGNNEPSLEKLKEELESVAGNYAGKVRVEGFLA